MRTYVQASRELAAAAGKAVAKASYEPALKACLLEIEQFHSLAYPDCTGGCPAHAAMAMARTALGVVP